MQELTHERIRRLWKAALLLQAIYLLLGLAVNFWKGPFLALFMVTDAGAVRPFTLWPQIACVAGNGVLFLVLDGLLMLRLREAEKLQRAAPEEVTGLRYRGLVCILGTGSFLALWLFPRMASGSVRETALRGLVDDSVDTATYAAMTTLNGQGGFFLLLLIPAVILLFCGLALLWNQTHPSK